MRVRDEKRRTERTSFEGCLVFRVTSAEKAPLAVILPLPLTTTAHIAHLALCGMRPLLYSIRNSKPMNSYQVLSVQDEVPLNGLSMAHERVQVPRSPQEPVRKRLWLFEMKTSS